MAPLCCRLAVVGGVAIGTLIGAADAQAQRAPDLPTTILPDVRLPGIPSPTPPPAAPEVSVPSGGAVAPPPGADAIRFRLTDLAIEGVTAYPPERFRPLYGALIGRDVTLTQLYAVAGEIQTIYRDDGYFLTKVIVPEQTIREGEFRLQVIEGFINSLDVEGDVGDVATLVRDYLGRLVGRRPISLADLERALLLCNDIPGMNVQGVLRPSRDAFGAAQLVARVAREPFDALLLVDNYGNEFTGLWQAAASGAANAFTRFGEQITVTGLISEPHDDPFNGYGDDDRQWVTQLATSWRFGGSGVFVETLTSYGESRPGFTVSEFNFDSNTVLASVSVGYPIIRSRKLSVIGRVGFDYLNLNTDVFGGEKITRDRLRVLHADTHVEYRDRFRGNNVADVSLQQGIPVLGATDFDDRYKSRASASNQAMWIEATAARLQPLYDGFEVFGLPTAIAAFGEAGGQYALINELLADALFDIGGVQYGRGYDLGELSGDDGVGFTGELQATQRLDNPYINTYQFFVFYDYGRVWNRKGGPDEALGSTGGGVRLSLLNHLTMDFTIAKPLIKDSERSSFTKDPQFLFRVASRF